MNLELLMCMSDGSTARRFDGFISRRGMRSATGLPGSSIQVRFEEIGRVVSHDESSDWTVITSAVCFFQSSEGYSVPAPLEKQKKKKTLSKSLLFRRRSTVTYIRTQSVESFNCPGGVIHWKLNPVTTGS